jgi:hypothetical protein
VLATGQTAAESQRWHKGGRRRRKDGDGGFTFRAISMVKMVVKTMSK